MVLAVSCGKRGAGWVVEMVMGRVGMVEGRVVMGGMVGALSLVVVGGNCVIP